MAKNFPRQQQQQQLQLLQQQQQQLTYQDSSIKPTTIIAEKVATSYETAATNKKMVITPESNPFKQYGYMLAPSTPQKYINNPSYSKVSMKKSHLLS